MRLADPIFLLLALLWLPVLLTGARPHLGYSNLGLFGEAAGAPVWARLPNWAMVLGICLLLVAVARPQWGQAVERERREARDIILALDLSGSMQTELRSGGGPKIDLAKAAALRFVDRRQGDRVGLLVFGHETYGSWPLSLDLEVIRDKILDLRPDLGGTDLAKPLERALAHFRELGQSTAKAVILVTDGEAPIPPQLRDELQKELAAMDVRVYLLGIDLGGSADIVDLVSRSGGRVFVFDLRKAEDFASAFEEIDRLEPSVVVVEKRVSHVELYPRFALGGLALLSLAVVGATMAPRIP